jgi:hypothetical protein
MLSQRQELAEQFKVVRADVPPVPPDKYHALYTAAASMVLRHEMTPTFSSLEEPELEKEPTDTHDILEQHTAVGWVDGSRIVGASVYTDHSVHKELFGIEADVMVAPEPDAPAGPLFELSTDGSLYWVTQFKTVRPATTREMDLMLTSLNSAA